MITNEIEGLQPIHSLAKIDSLIAFVFFVIDSGSLCILHVPTRSR